MKTTTIAAAAAMAALALPASAGQYSDLWYNPQEPGWGVNVVQQRETAFVTLFVYGPDGNPTWYVAPAARITHQGTAGPLFEGTLYRARGPWHGGPFDPAEVRTEAAGHLTLEVLARERMRVHYSADGSAVAKDVVRQTWEQPLVAATYVSQFVLRQVPSGGGPPIGVRDFSGDVQAHFDQGEGYLRVDDALRRCEYRGPYEQSGRLTRFSGAYTCTSGDAASGAFEFTDFEFSTNGFTGYLRTWSQDVDQYGRVAGVLR